MADLATSVVEALERQLKEWSKTDPSIGLTPLAALGLRLAAAIDNPRTSPNAASMVANSLKDVLVEIQGLVPTAGQESSPLDEIRARRERRMAAS